MIKPPPNGLKTSKENTGLYTTEASPTIRYPLPGIGLFLESNNSVGVEDSNMTAMTVLRHSGIVYAFNSDIWNKFN